MYLKNLLISKEERLQIKQDAKSVGNETIKYKVIDVDLEVAKIREERLKDGKSMIIRLEPAKTRKFVDPNFMFTYEKDPETGVLYGITVGAHQDGNPIWHKIRLKEKETFNLNHDNDCKKWAVLRFSSQVQGSPLAGEDVKYIVYDPEVEAKSQADSVNTMEKAIKVLKGLKTTEDIMGTCRYLGINLNTPDMTMSVAKGLLSQEVMSNPGYFLSQMTSSKRQYMQILNTAVDVNVISKKEGEGFMFGGIELGLTSEEAITRLEMEDDLRNAIIKQSKDKDDLAKKLAK